MRFMVVGWANQPGQPAYTFWRSEGFELLPGVESRLCLYKVVMPLHSKNVQLIPQPFHLNVCREILAFKPDYVFDVDESRFLSLFCLLLGIPVLHVLNHFPFSWWLRAWREAKAVSFKPSKPREELLEGLRAGTLSKAFHRMFRFDSFAQSIFVVPMQAIKQAYLRERPGLRPEWLVVAPHAVGGNYPFAPPKRARSDGVKRLLFVGHDVYLKGLEQTIQAFQELRREWPNLKLRIVSTGLVAPPDSGIEVTQVDRAAYLKEMPRHYNESDVMVLPTKADAMPYVVLEALASGLPVVVSRGVGYDEWIKDGVNGFLVEPTDVGAMVQGIREFLQASEGKQSMTRKACVETAHHLDSRHSCQQLVAQLEKMGGGPGLWARLAGIRWVLGRYFGDPPFKLD